MKRISPPMRTARLAGLAGLVTVVASACSQNPLDTTRAESPIAEEINTIFWATMAIAGVVFVLVQGAVIYMSRRFRAAGDPFDEEVIYTDEDFPAQTHGNTRLELGWTLLPALGMAVLAFFTVSLGLRLDDVEAQERTQISHIDVVGAQWWWEYHYYLDGNDTGHPDFVTANEIVIPVNEEVRLNVTSRDVIHSFWIPRLNGKRDAVPGRSSTWTLEAVEPGRYMGQCTEFCGLSHAYMQMFAVGVPADDYAAWAANQMADKSVPADDGSSVRAGYDTFVANCQRCHVINGVTDTNVDETIDGMELYGFGGDETIDRVIPDMANQVAGAAPNLTHLMSRTTFAGSIFELYEDPDDIDYRNLPATGTLNRGELEAWILNAPEEKANAADQEGAARGMPSFAGTLSGQQLDELVDYLLTLD